jgi:Ser/Thr protein kinase RdoA (MazF antagonist)
MTAQTTRNATDRPQRGTNAAIGALDDSALHAITACFAIDPLIGAIEPLGRGLINDTFSLTAGDNRYVLQRINGRVFPDPHQIMTNLQLLDAHLKTQGDGSLRLPTLIATRDGAACLRDEEGDYWRLMEFIPNGVTLERIESATQAREVGAILGRFHRSVAALQASQFGISLPGFHDSPAYLTRYMDSIGAMDAVLQDPQLTACAEFVAAREALARVLDTACREGRIARRVTHGDPKLDNILFSADSHRALALIDLDTVQPGLIHHDLGDCLRSCCNRTGEGTTDDGQVRFDLAVCEGILEGYSGETRGLLTRADADLFYDAIRLMPFELGLRFLTDHLDGDTYFRVSVRGENLRKARVQFALVKSIEEQEQAIRSMIERCYSC